MLKLNRQNETTHIITILLLLLTTFGSLTLASTLETTHPYALDHTRRIIDEAFKDDSTTSTTRIYVYGTDRDTGQNRTQLHLLKSSNGGSINAEGLSNLCFIAFRAEPQDSEILWLEKCLPNIDNDNQNPTINLEDVEETAVVKKYQLTATSSRYGPAGILLPHQDVTLTITSPTELKPINSNFDENARHSSLVPWHTDEDAEIFIRSNVDDLNLSFSTELKDSTSLKLSGQAKSGSAVIELRAQCSSDQTEAASVIPQLWNEKDSTPATETQAINEGWQRINRNCDDDEPWPGYRYENPDNSSFYGLVLIFDELEDLAGFQIALPRHMLNDSEQEKRLYQSQFHLEGLYDGDPAFLLTYYFGDHRQVCRPERILCSNSAELNEGYVILTKSSWMKLHRRQEDALQEGWTSEDEDNILFMSQSPWSAQYRNGNLEGLSTIHHVGPAAATKLEDSIFKIERDPQTSQSALRTSFYLGHTHSHHENDAHESIFHLKVKDSGGKPVEGAIIVLHHHHKQSLQAAQLSTDHRGHAFVAFHHAVHNIQFDIHTPKHQRLNQLWRADNPYNLHQHHRRQAVTVDRIKKAAVNIKSDLEQSLDGEILIWSKDHTWKRRLHHSKEIKPFYVNLDVTQVHLLHYDKQTLTFYTIDIDPNRSVSGSRLDGLDIHTTLRSHHQRLSKLNGIPADGSIEIQIGLPHLKAQNIQFQGRDMVLDMPEGILVAWQGFGPHHSTTMGSAITPFKETLLEKIHYDIQLEGLFPERADLHLEFPYKHKVVSVEDSIRHDRTSFDVPLGTQRGYLHVEEGYSSTVVVADFDPRHDIDRHRSSVSDEGTLKIQRKLYHRTAKVTVKMINSHKHRVPNVTLNYAIGFPFFGQNAMEASQDEAQVVFHLPEQTLVYIKPESSAHADPNNQEYFRAKDGMEVFLIFDNSHHDSSSIPITIALKGEGFDVPQGTYLRYVSKDDAGDPVDQGIVSTNDNGKAMIDLAVNTAYIDFAVGGSDGFDPVFFQPFDYVYNISSLNRNHAIEIPVKSWKNVIVSVKDCFTGEVIESRSQVKFPEDAASPHSWYDRQLMPNRHSAFVDDQGLAFFQLEPDVFVPIEVHASGYESYHSRISIASNVTQLVSADLCKKFTVEMTVIDHKHGNVAGHATVSVSIDEGKAFDVTTNSRGLASFHATTAMKTLSLQVTDADESIEQPAFELHDYMDFLKEVEVDVLERMYTAEIATASCQDFRHYPEVPVLVQITYKNDDDDDGLHMIPRGYQAWPSGHDPRQHLKTFVLTSDHHGYLRLKLHESAANVTLTVLQPPTASDEEPQPKNLGLMPSEDLPDRFQFVFRALPKNIEVNVRDAESHRRLTGAPVAVTYYDRTEDRHRTQNSITDGEGRAVVEVDGCVEFASFVVSSPMSDCYDYHEEKRHHWNILDQQKFTMALTRK